MTSDEWRVLVVLRLLIALVCALFRFGFGSYFLDIFRSFDFAMGIVCLVCGASIEKNYG